MQAGLGATLALPAGFTLGLRASLRRTEYQGNGFAHRTIDRKPREDERRTPSLLVHNRAVTVLGFSSRLSLIREECDANAQALGYKRNRGKLSLVIQFRGRRAEIAARRSRCDIIPVAPYGGPGRHTESRDMPDVNMKYLRTFLIQVEERSTQKTARRLGVTRTAVLAHLSAVEELVGQRLLERGSPLVKGQTGRAQLTEAGRAFLPKAIKAMNAHDLMFEGDFRERDPREDSRIIAMRFVEMALAALRHDLSEEERERLYNMLLD